MCYLFTLDRGDFFRFYGEQTIYELDWFADEKGNIVYQYSANGETFIANDKFAHVVLMNP